MNYYLHGHAAKITADVVYLPNGDPVGDDGSDVLPTGKDKNEVLLRRNSNCCCEAQSPVCPELRIADRMVPPPAAGTPGGGFSSAISDL